MWKTIFGDFFRYLLDTVRNEAKVVAKDRRCVPYSAKLIPDEDDEDDRSSRPLYLMRVCLAFRSVLHEFETPRLVRLNGSCSITQGVSHVFFKSIIH